jgi:hypothetical protein
LAIRASSAYVYALSQEDTLHCHALLLLRVQLQTTGTEQMNDGSLTGAFGNMQINYANVVKEVSARNSAGSSGKGNLQCWSAAKADYH